MASYTNVPFRQIAIECGSGFTTNEEIDAEALIRGNAWANNRGYGGAPANLGVVAMQLLGCTEDTLVPAALRLVEAGADIVDINMGCPVPKIVNRGKGAALMRDVAGTARILAAKGRQDTKKRQRQRQGDTLKGGGTLCLRRPHLDSRDSCAFALSRFVALTLVALALCSARCAIGKRIKAGQGYDIFCKRSQGGQR